MNPTPHPTPTLHLPDGFVFSQSSLQTYEDCQRRFWLTYIERLPWPAVEAGPIQEHEYLMRLGESFHRAVQRTEVGLPPELVRAQLEPPLDEWYDGYLAHRPADLPRTVVEIEAALSIPLALGDDLPEVRLDGKFDLLAVEPQRRGIIVDWKTTRKRTSPATLRRRLQSQVYPYLLVEASRSLPWGPLAPEQVEMRYWFTAAPDDPVRFTYDDAQHAANHRLLRRIVEEILTSRGADDFALLPDTEVNRQRVCAYCAYRSRCDRGIVPGDIDALDGDDDLLAAPSAGIDFDIEDIPELAF